MKYKVENDNDTRLVAGYFHMKAHEYMERFMALRKLVEDIRSEIKCDNNLESTNDIVELQDTGVGRINFGLLSVFASLLICTYLYVSDAEFEAKSSHPFPSFLIVIFKMYNRIHRLREWDPSVSSTEPPLDSLAQVSIFLAGHLFTRVPLTHPERQSVCDLLQVM